MLLKFTTTSCQLLLLVQCPMHQPYSVHVAEIAGELPAQPAPHDAKSAVGWSHASCRVTVARFTETTVCACVAVANIT